MTLSDCFWSEWVNFFSAERKIKIETVPWNCDCWFYITSSLHGVYCIIFQFKLANLNAYVSIKRVEIKQEAKVWFYLRFSFSCGTILSSAKTAPIRQTIWNVNRVNDMLLYHFSSWITDWIIDDKEIAGECTDKRSEMANGWNGTDGEVEGKRRRSIGTKRISYQRVLYHLISSFLLSFCMLVLMFLVRRAEQHLTVEKKRVGIVALRGCLLTNQNKFSVERLAAWRCLEV